MRGAIVVLLAVAVAAAGCGSPAKPKAKPVRRAAVPDVRGLNAPEAAVRVLRARYCVRLRPAKAVPTTTRAQVPVLRQSPAAGTRPRVWSTVTLTIGLPPDARKSVYFVDIAAAGSAPCPPISTNG